MKFVNTFRDRWGVEPICQTLEVAPSTYYAALNRAPGYGWSPAEASGRNARNGDRGRCDGSDQKATHIAG
ncbi:MAG: hypothetical protein ACYDA0_12645 [Candidatus Dormibacteraceae bacterium]